MCNHTYIALIKGKYSLEERIKHPHSFLSKHSQSSDHNMKFNNVKIKRIRPGQNPHILMKIVAKSHKMNHPNRVIQLFTSQYLGTYNTTDISLGNTLDQKIWQTQRSHQTTSQSNDPSQIQSSHQTTSQSSDPSQILLK